MTNDTLKMKEYIALLESELERLSAPPYVGATILEIGKKTARVGIDGIGIHEVALPDDKGLRKEMRQNLQSGSRVTVNPQSKAVIDFSEFNPQDGITAVVEELSKTRVKVSQRGETKYVLNSVDGLKPGDEVLLDPSEIMVRERISSRKTKYSLEKVQKAPWSDIGGLESTIEQIRDEVETPFVHKEVYTRYGRSPAKGILLYGPPGCGKTMIAKSIAYNLAQLIGNGEDAHFINVKGPEILDKFVGNSEANIRRIYATAREIANGAPVVVFIDEAESVFKSRGTGISTDVYDSIVPQFLAEMDGLNGNANIITILATNREDIIDSAVLRDGRVDRKIRVPRPDKSGATQIFGIYLKDKPIQSKGLLRTTPDLAKAAVEAIYDEKTPALYATVKDESIGSFYNRHFVSGAMIKGMIDRATGYAIKREISTGKKGGLTPEDLSQAFSEEMNETTAFTQSLVKDDWIDVFGAKGRNYHDLCSRGYVLLERASGDQDNRTLKGGKK